jgi:hypothetical protein
MSGAKAWGVFWHSQLVGGERLGAWIKPLLRSDIRFRTACTRTTARGQIMAAAVEPARVRLKPDTTSAETVSNGTNRGILAYHLHL